MTIEKGLFVSLILCVGLTLISASGLAQASAGSTVTFEGQLVCSSCWSEADRKMDSIELVSSYGRKGEPTGAAPAQAKDDKVQSVKITITDNGFEPSSFELQQGVPVRVTFLRLAEESCAKEVVIPAFHIKRALPFNEAVVVEFTPEKSGEFGFACGMGMLHGKLVVQ